MRRFMHRRLSPSMAVALLALFVALSGAGYAAVSSVPGPDGVIHSCYRKSTGSLRVVSPKTRCSKNERALAFNQKGPRGLPGSPGKQGTDGIQGVQGIQGPAGPLTTTLPSGQTLRGWFNFDTVATEAKQIQGADISFDFSLPSAPAVQIVPVGGAKTAQCAGSLSAPSAAPGYLCLYELSMFNVDSIAPCNTAAHCPGADPFGVEIFAQSGGVGRFYVDGTWAVTAP